MTIDELLDLAYEVKGKLNSRTLRARETGAYMNQRILGNVNRQLLRTAVLAFTILATKRFYHE